MYRYIFVLTTLFFVLAACTAPGPPPHPNSGSYDWSDSYRGPNGYPLPGWGP